MHTSQLRLLLLGWALRMRHKDANYGRHDPGASNSRASVTASGIQIQGDKPTAETGDKETSGRHDPGASVRHRHNPEPASSRHRDKRETRPRRQRHSIWHPTAETARQAGDTTPEPASQHLTSDRRDWETQGDKRETRPRSRRHSVWHPSVSIWHLTAETGR